MMAVKQFYAKTQPASHRQIAILDLIFIYEYRVWIAVSGYITLKSVDICSAFNPQRSAVHDDPSGRCGRIFAERKAAQ